MRVERLNHCVFWVSLVCFVLQGVGYLSPAWFVSEVTLTEGFVADGRKFNLPLVASMVTADERKEPIAKTVSPTMASTTRIWRTLRPWSTQVFTKRPAAMVTKTKAPTNESMTRITKRAVSPEHHDETTTRLFIPVGSSRIHVTEAPFFGVITEGEIHSPEGVGNNVGHETVSANINIDKGRPDRVDEQGANSGSGVSNEAPTNENHNDKEMETNDRETLKSSVKFMHLGVGLWYGRACVNYRNVLEGPIMDAGTEWCTLYIRTNTSTLDTEDRLFELRIEASFGLGLGLISLVLVGTLCCSRRHNGLRIALAVCALFVSGAVTAIPVVHVIVEHVTMHSKMVRTRNWDDIFINTHAQHDLFDHWSVILCGVTSILSILSAVVFSVLACRNSMTPSSVYDLGKIELTEKSEKPALKLSMIGNGKVTLPPETTFTKEAELKDRTDDGDSKPDSSAISNKDGEESISLDSFTVAEELTYKGDIDGNYADIDDATENLDMPEQQ